MRVSCWKRFQRFWRVTFPTGYKYEFIAIIKLAWPMILVELWAFILGPISLMFCGHLTKEALDGAALAISTFNVTGNSVAAGLCTACDTLFAQSFGSTNKKQVGAYLQKGVCTLILCALPCCMIMLNAEPLLLLMGQSPDVANIAADYIIFLIPGLFGVYFYQIVAKFLSCQNRVRPMMIVGAIVNIINAILQYILVFALDWGYRGSALGQALSYWCLFFGAAGYVLISGVYKLTWPGWKLSYCLNDWGEVYKLAIPGMLMIMVEWSSFEAGIILSGLLGKVELAVSSIMMQLEAFSYMVPLGIGVAASIRCGNHLGGNNPLGAKTASRVAMTMLWVGAFFTATLYVSLRWVLPLLFTNDQEVIVAAAAILPILGIFQFMDGTAGVNCAILRGSGLQKYGAIIVLITFFVIGDPLAFSLMFLTPLGLTGLWGGLVLAMGIEAVLTFICIYRIEWDLQAKLAQIRAGVTESSKDDNANPFLTSSYSAPGNPRKKIVISSSIKRNAIRYSHDPEISDEHDENSYTESSALISRNEVAVTCATIMKRIILVTIFSIGFIASLVYREYWYSNYIGFQSNCTTTPEFNTTQLTPITPQENLTQVLY